MTFLPLVTAILVSPVPAMLPPGTATSVGWDVTAPEIFTLGTPARPYTLATLSIWRVPTPVSANAPVLTTAKPAARISLVMLMVLLLLFVESIHLLCDCTWIHPGRDENPFAPRMVCIKHQCRVAQ